MNRSHFAIFSLILTAGLMHAYSFFQLHFSGVDSLKQRITYLEKELRQEKVKTFIALNEAEFTRQEVATLLPDQIKNNKADYKVRALASVLQVQEPLDVDSSAIELQKAKNLFSETKYHESIAILQSIIERFPSSSYITEVYFLLVEAYFQTQAIEQSVDTIEKMIVLFPESELTGFSLLRMSTILLDRGLTDDAKETLEVVKINFAFNRELVEQAEKALGRIK